MRVFSGRRAFVASCAFIIGMLASGVYPDVLPSNGDRLFPDDLQRGHARYGVEVGLTWFVPGILLAAAYFFYTYRSFSGKDPRLIRKLLRMAEIENARRCSDRVPKPS